MTQRSCLVLLPGLLDDHTMWSEQVRDLGDVAETVTPDLVAQDSVGDSADFVLDSAPGTFALAGFSMGGYVALEILRRAPERVAKLALISTSARADTPERTAERHAMIAHAEAGDYRALIEDLLPRVIHADRAGDEALLGAIRDMAMRIGPEAFVRQLKVIMSRPDSRADLAGIHCPTLVLCGRDDVVTPVELSQEMASGIADARLVLVERCNHYAPMESPEEVTEALRSWLQDDGTT